jgi:uncharacterized protein (TIGR02246 family)
MNSSQRADAPSAVEAVIQALDGWKHGIDQQRPADIATYFTKDALFQGSHPTHTIGSDQVAEYYSEDHAAGLSVRYEIQEIRPLGDGVLSAFVDPTFIRPDGTELPYHLTVILLRQADGRWLISHYHVSKIA